MTPNFTVASQTTTLTAQAMVVTGFTYVGNVDLTTKAGTKEAMEFTVTSANMTGLTLSLPCSGNVRWTLTTPPASVSTAHAGLTLYATRLTGTTASDAIDWTPVAPPDSADPLGGGSGTIDGVSVTLAALLSPSLALAQSSETSSAC